MQATHPKTEQKLQLHLISHINIMPSPIQKVNYEPYSKALLLIVTTKAHPEHTRQFVPIIIFGCSHAEFDCHAYTHLQVSCCESFSRSRSSKCSPTLLKLRKHMICASLYAQRYTAIYTCHIFSGMYVIPSQHRWGDQPATGAQYQQTTPMLHCL